MPKSVPISVIDSLLDKIATANFQIACADEPKHRDDAASVLLLLDCAEIVIASSIPLDRQIVDWPLASGKLAAQNNRPIEIIWIMLCAYLCCTAHITTT